MPYNFSVNVSIVYPDGWEDLDVDTVLSGDSGLDDPYVQAVILDSDGTPSDDPELTEVLGMPFRERMVLDPDSGQPVISVNTSEMERFGGEIETVIRNLCDKYIMLQHSINFSEEYDDPEDPNPPAEEEAPAE